MIPGFTISLLVIVIVSLLTQPSKEIEEQFENFEKQHSDNLYRKSSAVMIAELSFYPAICWQ